MLETEALSYSIQEKQLLKEVSLKFEKGSLYTILGPNGSGKSTFLKLLVGIWRPTSGRILWEGVDLFQRTRREISAILSFVPQGIAPSFDYQVEEFVRMGGYARHLKDSEGIEWAMRETDVWGLKEIPLSRISMGERQRVYIARALATAAPVIILDEPTSSLDVRHQRKVWHLLRQLANQGKTVIVANHDLRASEILADWVAILDEGMCVSSGAFQQAMTPSIWHNVFGVPLSNGRAELLPSSSMD